MRRSAVVDLVLTTALFGAVLAVVLHPSLIPEGVYDSIPVEGEGLRTIYLGILASLLLLYLGWRIVNRFRRSPRGSDVVGRANENGDDGERATHYPSWTIDEQIAAAVDGWDHREKVRAELRSVAVELLARERGFAEDRARTRIESGEWTGDRRASAFLGGPEAPAPSLRVRIFDWLSVEGGYARGLDATITELESIVEDIDETVGHGGSS